MNVFGSGHRGWRGVCVDEMIGFGFYQSCGNRGSVGRVSVFGLRLCGWCRWGMGSGLEGWCYVCVSCESALSVYMACQGIFILC